MLDPREKNVILSAGLVNDDFHLQVHFGSNVGKLYAKLRPTPLLLEFLFRPNRHQVLEGAGEIQRQTAPMFLAYRRAPVHQSPVIAPPSPWTQ